MRQSLVAMQLVGRDLLELAALLWRMLTGEWPLEQKYERGLDTGRPQDCSKLVAVAVGRFGSLVLPRIPPTGGRCPFNRLLTSSTLSAAQSERSKSDCRLHAG